MQPVLSVEGLAKAFFLHEQRATIPSCSGVSLTCWAGKLTAIVGPTGSGKSSVLKCIYRTYLPSAGQILFREPDGKVTDLVRADEHEVLRLRRRGIGFVTQFLNCLPRRSALDVVAEPLVAQGVQRTAARRSAGEMLARLAVPERLWGVAPATFSGGEKQRVNLARGLISRPRLLLLDEPSLGLAPLMVQHMFKIIREIRQKGVTILLAEQNAFQALDLADQAFVLETGKVIVSGTGQDLLDNPLVQKAYLGVAH